jgi:hypothetical protein
VARSRRSAQGLRSAVTLAFGIVLAGCGGGGGSSSGSGTHTYIVTPTAPSLAGIYITSISPAALPRSALSNVKREAKFVGKAKGPEACSYSYKIRGLTGKYANVNGKTVRVKVNGSNPLISQMCAYLRKQHSSH